MTAEVAIMNQHALVLAADSATTVTMWVQGERQTRYFKGANKLYQLSDSYPVGLMIYGSASIEDVPWELIVKEFRKTNGDKSSDKLSEYAQRFFEFVKSHSGFFPADARLKAFNVRVGQAAYRNLVSSLETDEFKAVDSGNSALQQEVLSKVLQDRVNLMKAMAPQEPIKPEDVDAAVATHIEAATAYMPEVLKALPDGTLSEVPAPILAELALRALLCYYKFYLSETGVVVGGFGEKEFFPSFEVFDCFGFLDHHFIANRNGETSNMISSDVPAAIEPFATASMINTFRMGMGPDVYTGIVNATENALRSFAESIRNTLAPDRQIENLDDMIAVAAKECRKDWFQRSMNNHYWPFSRVVASLPISDMAALAKSLIELESLKERVTDSSESVSGPIDVAAITKHDGFVWIERKHYFKPELNSRFFARQRAYSRG
jgi:hypothetical protein